MLQLTCDILDGFQTHAKIDRTVCSPDCQMMHKLGQFRLGSNVFWGADWMFMQNLFHLFVGNGIKIYNVMRKAKQIN